MNDTLQEIGNVDGSDVRNTVADTMTNASDRLHDKADRMEGGKMSALTNRAANALDATGRYVRDLESRDVMSDLGDVAKRHPGTSVLVAAALGFLVGRVLTRPNA